MLCVCLRILIMCVCDVALCAPVRFMRVYLYHDKFISIRSEICNVQRIQSISTSQKEKMDKTWLCTVACLCVRESESAYERERVCVHVCNPWLCKFVWTMHVCSWTDLLHQLMTSWRCFCVCVCERVNLHKSQCCVCLMASQKRHKEIFGLCTGEEDYVQALGERLVYKEYRISIGYEIGGWRVRKR